jgi:hypothetical protein
MSNAELATVSPAGVLLSNAQRSSALAGQDRNGPGGAVTPAGYPSPHGYTPGQIRQAYGFDKTAFVAQRVPGDGSGQTIALIDAYDDPNIASDLQAFDGQFGLPDPVLTKVAQDGSTRYPAPDGYWASEIALDVEWAHAIAPRANILLVETYSSYLSDMLQAVRYVRDQPGVVAVAMSWGCQEFAKETADDYYFLRSTGVTFLAATGDSGAYSYAHDIRESNVWYPAVSPEVVAVGGTNLVIDSAHNLVSEDGWGGSGGGAGFYEFQPGYQRWIGPSAGRTIPDVAYNAGQAVTIYDSYNDPVNPWFGMVGTSAGVAQWAGLIAIADQGRALKGLAPLDGLNQTLPLLYALQGRDFHDITTGNNGYAAGSGYDLVTGLGSPMADRLVADLASGVGNTSAMSWSPHGFGTQRTFYAIDANMFTTVEYLEGSSVRYLYGPTITAVSASLYDPNDLSGSEVFALGADHATYVYNATGWHNLGGWARMLCAARDDHVFVIGGDDAVYVNTSGGNEATWQCLGGGVTAISVGADYSGADQVFAIGEDNHIYVHDGRADPSARRWQLVDGTASFTQISATQQGTVYALDRDGNLHHSYLDWGSFVLSWVNQAIAPAHRGQRFEALSADSQDAGDDEVYVIDASPLRAAYLYQSVGGWKWDPVAILVTDLSGADYGAFYFSRWGIPDFWNGSHTVVLPTPADHRIV